MPIRDDGAHPPQGLPAFAAMPVAAIIATLAALLTALSGRYGFHRDELYFLVAGDRPAWGYVDQPPLTPLLARASATFFGDTPAGLRVVATLLACAAVVVVALVARELGGGRGAQVMAACCAGASGLVFALGHMVNTASFDMLAWLVISLLVLRLLRTRDPRWYLAIGAVVGVGLENKRLVALLVLGLLLAVLAVGPRRMLRTWWLAAGAAVALALALPNLWWEAAHGWPQLTVAARISQREAAENRVMFVPLQILQLSPLFVPIWVAGLVRLWRDPAIRWARAFAVAYPLLVAVTLLLGGRSYYVLPLLMVVMAAGAEPAVRWARRGLAGRSGLAGRRRILAAMVLVAAVVNLVVTLPVLPPTAVSAVNGINDAQGEQIGWPRMVSTVAQVWYQIPPEQRARAVILTHNYGEAGAVARYGPGQGLPPAYAAHMSYADWGPPPDSADGPVLLVLPKHVQWVFGQFTGCQPRATIDNGYGVDNESGDNVVMLCSGTAAPWSTVWPRLRHY